MTLAVGGTLMLFTSQSAVATNVVTLGNMKVTFKEGSNSVLTTATELPETTPEHLLEPGVDPSPTGFTQPDGATYEFTGTDSTFSGITYTTEIIPNAIISKVPVITYEGVPGYVRVRADIEVTDGENDVSLDDFPTELAGILNDIITELDLPEEFVKVPIAGDTISYYFYYAPEDPDNDSTATLTPVDTDTFDEDGEVLFYGFKVPSYTGKNALNAFTALSGYSVELKLQVEAVQADWNNPTEASAITDSTWDLYFSELNTPPSNAPVIPTATPTE